MRKLTYKPDRYGHVPKNQGRLPPHEPEAERAVLSACLLDGEALDAAVEVLEPAHFYIGAHQLMFEGLRALAVAGVAVDAVSLAGWLRDRQKIQQAGGAVYIAEVIDATPAVVNVLEHAKIVIEKSRLRQLIAVCREAAIRAYEDVGNEQQFIDVVEQAIYEISHQGAQDSVWRLKRVLAEAFKKLSEAADRGDEITGTPTGYPDLDKKIAGLHKGELTLVAARPGMGKTAFVLCMAQRVAERVAPREYDDDPVEYLSPVLVLSLEMPKEQLGLRMVCSEGGVDLGKMRHGKLSQDDWHSLTAAGAQLGPLPIWIDDMPALSVLEIRARARRINADLKRQGLPPLGLIIIDYLQLMRADGGETREQAVAQISGGLKNLAKEIDVPVVALSQLNRGVETRSAKEKRPLLSDLRESGSLEQDADNVIFIYRDEYYNRDSTDLQGIAELIVAKQRNGPTGTVRLRFVKSCTRFETLAPGEYEEFLDFGDEY